MVLYHHEIDLADFEKGDELPQHMEMKWYDASFRDLLMQHGYFAKLAKGVIKVLKDFSIKIGKGVVDKEGQVLLAWGA